MNDIDEMFLKLLGDWADEVQKAEEKQPKKKEPERKPAPDLFQNGFEEGIQIGSEAGWKFAASLMEIPASERAKMFEEKKLSELSYKEAAELVAKYKKTQITVGSKVTNLNNDRVGVVTAIYTKMSPLYGKACLLYADGRIDPAVDLKELKSEGERTDLVKQLFEFLL